VSKLDATIAAKTRSCLHWMWQNSRW